MSDQRITELTPTPFVANDDLLAIVRDPDGTPSTRRATFNQVAAMLSNNPNLVIPDPVPSGTIVETIRDTPPSGWVFMNGQTLQNAQSVFPALWAAVPATFKSGANIILPDLRGRVTVHSGAGPGLTNRTLGGSGGAETHTLTTAQMPSHQHGGATTGPSTNQTSANSVGHTHGMNHIHDRGAHNHTVGGAGGHAHGLVGGHSFVGSQSAPNQAAFQLFPGSQIIYTTPTTAAVGDHTHPVSGGGGATSNSRNVANVNANRHTTDGESATHTHTLSSHTHTVNSEGGGQAHNNMQPFVVINKMIKL